MYLSLFNAKVTSTNCLFGILRIAKIVYATKCTTPQFDRYSPHQDLFLPIFYTSSKLEARYIIEFATLFNLLFALYN